MKPFYFFLIAVFIFNTENIQAQFSGKVIAENQQPLQDIMILNLRTNEHMHSDSYGAFAMKNCRIGDTIQFSFIGFKTEKQILSDQDNFQNRLIIMQETALQLGQVNISEPLQRNLQQIDLHMNPVQNSQELMRKVPGLFIAQHAGGGKAEQMFLRGFDLDHGTDISISVDHLLPVNMVSHAHGQGYSDLHFIIPETVKNIDFEKGSYNASKGNLATAGYVDFNLQEKIQHNALVVETGKFQYNRTAALLKLADQEKSNAYIAGEYVTSVGYFDHPQDFHKFNGLIKYNYKFNPYSGFKLTGSYFNSKWNASGQIPQRAVDAGLIGRFGAIDPNEGGQTSRGNAMFQYYLSKKAYQLFKVSGYYSHYDFELYSNFSFYLKDSVNGDQIRQKEHRNIYGLETNLSNQLGDFEWEVAIGTRVDEVNDLELSHTKDRINTLERKSFGDLIEENIYSYLKLKWIKHNWDIQLQGRTDYFHVNYTDQLKATNNITRHHEFITSPKLNLFYAVNNNLQLYAKAGMGFHSNDSRLIIQNPESRLLTRCSDADFGLQWKVGEGLFHLGLWYIDLENELVYVGDEAIVETTGHTERKGLEAGFRWQLTSWLSLDADGSYTLAKQIDASENNNFIPLASKWCSSGGILIKDLGNLSFGFRYRFLGDRPANEDYSITAKGYQLVDGNANYNYKNITFSLIAENIFNAKWNEAQFATLSRLQNEAKAVDEIHFTPGTPFNFRFKVQFLF